MARNQEKALTLYSQWNTFKNSYHASGANKRPLLATDCSSLPDAEKHRRDIMREISKKISSIHNAALGEHLIRELNDDINKLHRTKHYWEIRIKELGGQDYKALSKRSYIDVEGKELPGTKGYRYYGAAKDLPGVRELFLEESDAEKYRKNKKNYTVDRYKNITPDYYGFRDDDEVEEEVGASASNAGKEPVSTFSSSLASLLKSGSEFNVNLEDDSQKLSKLQAKELEMEKHWRDLAEKDYHQQKKQRITQQLLSNIESNADGFDNGSTSSEGEDEVE